MNRDEQKLREVFERKLGDLKPSTPVETIRRGAKRGRVITALATVVFVSIAGIGGYALTRTTDPQDRVVGPGPAADEGQIAFARFGQGIVKMNPDGSEIATLVADKVHAVDDPAWAPDGSFVAFHGYLPPADNEEGALFIVR